MWKHWEEWKECKNIRCVNKKNSLSSLRIGLILEKWPNKFEDLIEISTFGNSSWNACVFRMVSIEIGYSEKPFETLIELQSLKNVSKLSSYLVNLIVEQQNKKRRSIKGRNGGKDLISDVLTDHAPASFDSIFKIGIFGAENGWHRNDGRRNPHSSDCVKHSRYATTLTVM